ncbi:serine/threonine-protein kinase pakC-like [Tropilaelaps mercedesae]|uniref:non-specific serine/threonine protein kinase n=1 Tax=Tropilaelaps mercedesae TaxID=418985 RepID=A0A1V9WZX7_9ACAR|nr:serine/threonine-protein kinase pakC-like [Tropilaelaps mercedesae]
MPSKSLIAWCANALRSPKATEKSLTRNSVGLPGSAFTSADIDLPIKAVQTMHCEVHPTKGLIGLPKEWKASWETLQKKQQKAELDLIHRKTRKFPQNTMRKDMPIYRRFFKCEPNAKHDLAALEVLSEPGALDSKYDIQQMIGNGGFGKVFHATERRNGRAVAIKQCNPCFISKTPHLYLNELIALKFCKHRNIVSFIASYMATPVDDKADDKCKIVIPIRVPFIVMELMEESLSKILRLVYATSCLPEPMARYIMRELLTGLAFLHGKGILHLDLKSDNVLVSRNGEVKIADFGLSRRFTHREQKLHLCTGTALWMSPEMHRGQPCTYRTDIWSLGILFIELLDGKPPYLALLTSAEQKNLVENTIATAPPARPQRPVSPELADVFEVTLCKQPEKRRPCSAILEMPALQRTPTMEEFSGYIRTVLEKKK